MKKAVIFILGMTLGTAYASRVYNPEETQKLKELIDSTKNYDEAVEPAFLKKVKEFVQKGANPNLNDKTNDNTLLDLLIQGSFWKKDTDFILLNDALKTMIDNGAQIIIDPEKPYFFGNAISSVPASTIEILIKSGKNQKQIEQNTENALKIVDMFMVRAQKELQDAQKEVDRLNSVIQAIKPLTKK
jgi:hypothetical protein